MILMLNIWRLDLFTSRFIQMISLRVINADFFMRRTFRPPQRNLHCDIASAG